MSRSSVAGPSLSECIAALAVEAETSHGVPRDVAEHAARATSSRLAELAGRPVDRATRARASAYFWTVVTRRAVRRSSARDYARAVVRRSIEQDLRDAGWDAGAISRELQRSVV